MSTETPFRTPNGLRGATITLPKGETHSAAAGPTARLLIVTGGTLTLTRSGTKTSTSLAAGDALTIPAGKSFSLVAGEDAALILF